MKNGEQHIGTWITCPGCRGASELDAIGAALFDVGHFNCSHCGAQWEDCRVPDCFGYDASCPCQETSGWRPYIGLEERLAAPPEAAP